LHHLSCPYDPPLGRRPDVIERVTGHQRQYVVAGRSENSYIIGIHHPYRLHFVLEIAGERREFDFIVDLQIFQRAKERVPVPGQADVAGMSRQRRAGNMSHPAAQGGSIDPFGDHGGKKQTRDFQAADQTVYGDGRRGLRGGGDLRLRRALAGHLPVAQQAIELPALASLENPGVHQDECAIAQKQDAARKEPALAPSQHPAEWLFFKYKPHGAFFSSRRGSPLAM